MRTSKRQCADAVLMVRPAAFDYNPETAASNRMQRPAVQGGVSPREAARAEFAQLVLALQAEGVRVCLVDDTAQPPKPDAVFPNNWISFHADGTVVLYPMLSAIRRQERREDIVAAVSSELDFEVRRTLDLTGYERDGRFLEGTGSLVLDHVARVAYACRSPRTDATVLEHWGRELGYETVSFDAADATGVPLYHTNVLMCIGTNAVVVGAEAIAAEDRDRVLGRLGASGREIIQVGHDAIAAFAGNMLELASWDEALGDYSVLVMSASARAALGNDTYARLSACVDNVVAVPIPTIERVGGGSVRCMLAEVFSTS
jgi:hypothetical protein